MKLLDQHKISLMMRHEDYLFVEQVTHSPVSKLQDNIGTTEDKIANTLLRNPRMFDSIITRMEKNQRQEIPAGIEQTI